MGKKIDPVVVLGAVRTPVTARGGRLEAWHAVDLLARTLQAVCDRTGVSPDRIDQVIAGCATPVGEQALNIGRNAVLAAGWPEHIGAITVDGQGISGQMALHAASAQVKAGLADVVIAAGVEAMSRVPVGASTGMAVGKPFGPTVHRRFDDPGLIAPPALAEGLARRFGLTRIMLDQWAATSRHRRRVALDSGAFKAELVSFGHGINTDDVAGGFTVAGATQNPPASQEGPTTQGVPATQDVGLEDLQPMTHPDGVITAGNFAVPADGAAVVLVSTMSTAEKLRMHPLAQLGPMQSSGTAMTFATTGADVSRTVLERAGAELADVHLFGVQESSAAMALAWAIEMGLPVERVNPAGGALATGEPFGAAGLLAIVSMLHALDRDEAGLGLFSGSTTAMTATTVLERVST